MTARAPLADDGGPTFTAALTTGSPAHHAGRSLQSRDQRNFSRVLPHDIGAFELGADPWTADAPAAHAEEAGMAELVWLDASRLAAGTCVLVVEGTTVRATRSVTLVR